MLGEVGGRYKGVSAVSAGLGVVVVESEAGRGGVGFTYERNNMGGPATASLYEAESVGDVVGDCGCEDDCTGSCCR